MRRSVLAGALLGAVLLLVAPATAASAAPATAGGGWVRVPSPPFDADAGVLCDFPIHADPIVDQVVEKVLTTYPDGTTKSAAFKGGLVYRVTDTVTGAHDDADASGDAIINFGTDGSQTWYAVGPVIARIRAGASNLPRGLYTINGVYRIDISPTRFIKVTLFAGTEVNICTRLG
jgi:hypothetical protein